jgi:hypothetical protein
MREGEGKLTQATHVQAITVWLTAEEGSEVFAQGRHILSPTKAHDARAVQERGDGGADEVVG